MRAYSWIALGTVALACSGSAFTANDEAAGGANGDAGEDGNAGVLNRAGRGSGGSLIGSGGKLSSAGNSFAGDVSSGGLIGVGGDSGVGGDLVVGGSFTVGGSTNTAGAGTGGSDPAPVDQVCPKTMPTAGGMCSDGLVCSYTADVRTACRPLAKCDGGKWTISKPECEALHACPTLEIGKACDANLVKPCMLNATDGIYCVCTGCGSGGACSSETVWACAGGSGGASCPKLPPNKGQMCSVDTPCGYGSCATENGVNAVCENGTWDWDGVLCPL
jgi:hypothetical protein